MNSALAARFIIGAWNGVFASTFATLGPRASTDTVSRTLELGTEILRHGMTRSAPDGVPGPDAHHPEGDGTN